MRSILISAILLTCLPAWAGTVPTRRELATDYRRLYALELKYLASYRRLSTEPDADAITTKLTAFVQKSTSDEKPDAKPLLAELTAWFKSQEAHQALIDQLNVDKLDYFVKQIRFFTESTHHDLAANENLESSYRRILEIYDEYLGSLGKYGTPKDGLRLAAVRSIFAEAKKYFGIVEKVSGPKVWLPKGVVLKSEFRKFAANVKLLGLVPDALQLGSDILLRGGGKINRTVNDAFLKAARLRGYEVTVKGMENLAIATVNKEEKTINIITKVHRGAILDNMVLAELHLKDYAFVTSFGGDIPKFYSSRLVDNPGIAFVGPGFPNGIETVTEKAIHNPEHIMVNYAEGSIGNMGETRPIAKKFATDLIPELWKKGWRVNLIPVTSQAASFMKKDFGSDLLFGKVIEARVHHPIPHDVITFLEKNGHLEDLGILIRATWLSELTTDYEHGGKLIEGALSIRGFEEMTLKYMNLQNGEEYFCPRLLSE